VTTLFLTPSQGMGGGIERYASSLEEALLACGETVQVFPLLQAPAASGGKFRFTVAALGATIRRRPTLLVAAHVGLLPVLLMASWFAPRARVVLILHGAEIWGGMKLSRRLLVRYQKRVELVTVSNFSSGAVSMLGRASTVVRPVLEPGWHALLREASQPFASRDIDLLSVFRLPEWQTKGAPALFEAHAQLSAVRPLRTVLAGKGPVPHELAALAEGYGIEIRCDLTDTELARLYGRTKVFFLATQLRMGSVHSGEGFGIVLIEAQAAGACVLAPESGGSADAFDEGITGWQHPSDSAATKRLVGALLDVDRSEAAKEFVSRRFTQERLIGDVQKFVRS